VMTTSPVVCLRYAP